MRTIWNPSKCYKLAKCYLPEEKLNVLKYHILSVPWKFSLCHYHKDEYRRLVKYPTNVGMNKELIEAVGKIIEMSAGTEVGKEYRITHFFAEAHVIAFAQALHSTADILSYIIEICLKLNMANKQINFTNALDALKKQKIAPEVSRKANKILSSKEFMYLNAFVNTIKHRRLIEIPVHVNLEPGKELHGLRISSFIYGKSKSREIYYEPKWVHEFLDGDFEKISNMVGELGAELNHYMKAYLVK